MKARSGDGSLRLAMSLLVRDEAGLIAENIAFHGRMGVDCFVVTDNGSVDGTREIVERLRKDFPIRLIDEPEHTMRQDAWVNRMAEIAANEFGADWIINSDADEFWLPGEGTLKTIIPDEASVLLCRRANMLATHATVESRDYTFRRNTLRVARPFDNSAYREPPWRLMDKPVVMAAIGRKVMCRLAGLRRIGYGNHDAIHEGSAVESGGVHVFHYPVRTFEEFKSKVINHGTSLVNNPRIPSHIGWHVRRWYSLYEDGLLQEEYQRLLVDQREVQNYLRSGVLEVDDSISRAIESFV